MKKIIASIDKATGRITIKTEGYAGADCLAATKALEDGLGLNTDACELSPEYYQQSQNEQEQKT